MPRSFLNKAAPADEGLARLNQQYYEMASSESFVIALLNFELFTDAKAGSIPLTLQMQRKIGETITNKDRRPQDSSGCGGRFWDFVRQTGRPCASSKVNDKHARDAG